MVSLLRHEKKEDVGSTFGKRCSIVAPRISIPASRHNTSIIVTGLNPPLLFYEGRSINHHAGDCLHLVYKQQPDYTDKATRLQSFKYWDGPIPPLELVDAGYHMIARDTVKCYWCGVVIANWRREDSPIDIHCLRRPNCDFVKNYMEQLSEVDGNRACDEGRVGHQYGEKLVIKGRVNRGDSSINSVGPSTAQLSLDNISNSPQVVRNHLIAGINYPISHRSVATHGHEVKDSGRKSSEEILSSPPWEEIVFSERRLNVDSIVNVQEDEVIVPKMMCKMCYVQKVDHVFLPCGDAKTCKGCAIQWFKSSRLLLLWQAGGHYSPSLSVTCHDSLFISAHSLLI